MTNTLTHQLSNNATDILKKKPFSFFFWRSFYVFVILLLIVLVFSFIYLVLLRDRKGLKVEEIHHQVLYKMEKNRYRTTAGKTSYDSIYKSYRKEWLKKKDD